MSQNTKPHPRVLLVEGDEDKRVIPEFMEKFIPWGGRENFKNWPANIIPSDGVEELLKPGFIETVLKSPGLIALGVVVDADDNPTGRWRSVRERAIKQFPDIPVALPPDGLVVANESGLRFGVWLMPNCFSTGMLETFLAMFVREQSEALWLFSEGTCRVAKSLHNAPYRDAHFDKARVHAWLAVQDPPGQQLHSAILQKTLAVESPLAKPFVAWFRRLFVV